MAYKNIKIGLIESAGTRKTTYKRRKARLLKKLGELITLCGVEGCIIIYSPYEVEPTVWPSQSTALPIISQYQLSPEGDRSKRSLDQNGLFNTMSKKYQKSLKRACGKNREHDVILAIYDCLLWKGSNFDDMSHEDFCDLWKMAKLYRNELQSREDWFVEGRSEKEDGLLTSDRPQAIATTHEEDELMNDGDGVLSPNPSLNPLIPCREGVGCSTNIHGAFQGDFGYGNPLQGNDITSMQMQMSSSLFTDNGMLNPSSIGDIEIIPGGNDMFKHYSQTKNDVSLPPMIKPGFEHANIGENQPSSSKDDVMLEPLPPTLKDFGYGMENNEISKFLHNGQNSDFMSLPQAATEKAEMVLSSSIATNSLGMLGNSSSAFTESSDNQFLINDFSSMVHHPFIVPSQLAQYASDTSSFGVPFSHQLVNMVLENDNPNVATPPPHWWFSSM